MEIEFMTLEMVLEGLHQHPTCLHEIDQKVPIIAVLPKTTKGRLQWLASVLTEI